VRVFYPGTDTGGGIGARQVAHLGVRGVVVDGGVAEVFLLPGQQVAALLVAERGGHIEVLFPPAVIMLVEQQLAGNANRLGATIPVARLFHGVLPSD
jgi:hypothetical protein